MKLYKLITAVLHDYFLPQVYFETVFGENGLSVILLSYENYKNRFFLNSATFK